MTPDPRWLASNATTLAELLSLPPLGRIGRHKYRAFLRAAGRLFGADGVTVGFWTSPQEIRRFRLLANEVGSEIHEDVLDPGDGEGPVREVLRSGGTRRIRGASEEISPGQPGGYPAHASLGSLLVGLKMRDEPPAVLTLHRFEGQPFDESEEGLAAALAPLLGAALDNLRRFARAEELSITDGLTGVYNYRYLRSALDKEVARARRFRETFSIIMLDVDHLKEYNDVHGHLRGSEVLRRLAQIMMGELRGADVVAKYGGDEFVVILPQTDRDGAKVLAERIRRSIEGHEFPGVETGMRITSSMGIAEFPRDGESSRDLLEAADRALYDAKRTGRNRVTTGAGRP